MKPCPFCGEKQALRITWDEDGGWFVVCDQCCAQGPEVLAMSESNPEIVEAWDRAPR